jgi:ABC-2 type transport system permease protein
MNTQANTIPESPVEAQRAASLKEISVARQVYWSVRRELWEMRFLYVAPLIVAALIVAGSLLGLAQLPDKIRAALALGPMQQREAIQRSYSFAALLIMFTTFAVGVVYCLEAMHGERRDRSILFWKSLPVSDLTTVLSKASIPLVVLPLLTFGLTVVTQMMVAVISSAVLAGSGIGAGTLWSRLSLPEMWGMLLYHLIAIHSLWYAPIYGWLLMVSAWARRAAFLWAALPLFAIGLVEKIAFNTSNFAAMLESRMSGDAAGNLFGSGGMSMDAAAHLTPGSFLLSPGLWAGLALTTLFLAVAVSLRRRRGPI